MISLKQQAASSDLLWPVALLPHRKVRVGKKDCSMDAFIGAPYGAVYSLDDDGKTLRRCARQGLLSTVACFILTELSKLLTGALVNAGCQWAQSSCGRGAVQFLSPQSHSCASAGMEQRNGVRTSQRSVTTRRSWTAALPTRRSAQRTSRCFAATLKLERSRIVSVPKRWLCS